MGTEDGERNITEVPGGARDGRLLVDLEGFEGPLDVLLALAREQKVDLLHISILALAEQYLGFIRRAQELRLEIAADYLVMAAWLAYLKSRLLLPQSKEGEEPTGPELAAALRFQLQRLEALRRCGERLMARPRLGVDVFARGAPEPVATVTSHVYDLSLYELLRAYGDIRGRGDARALRIVPSDLYTVEDALKRLSQAVGGLPDWQTLMSFLPADIQDGLVRRSALAATFAASLELARAGRLELRQDRAFGPIYVRGRSDREDEP